MSVLLDEYTDAALRGDRAVAAELAGDFAGRDPTCLRVVTQLLAPSQREVGNRWLAGECGVGEEHTATFVTESVLSSLAVGLEPPDPVGTIVMVVAEGESHTLPARMATELLLAGGWRVIYLGGAVPGPRLREFLSEVEADAVGVSATLSMNLPGAARTARVARKLGFPVLCGGSAFDPGGRRARAIGGCGQPEQPTDRLVLDDVVWGTPPLPDSDGDWARLDFERVRIVRDALSWLGAGDFADRVRSATWLEQVTAELDDVVTIGAAATLCDDPLIVAEHHKWLEARLTVLGAPADIAERSFEAVAAVVDNVVPGASSLFR